jgi:hypothetical protein
VKVLVSDVGIGRATAKMKEQDGWNERGICCVLSGDTISELKRRVTYNSREM